MSSVASWVELKFSGLLKLNYSYIVDCMDRARSFHKSRPKPET